MIDTPGRSSTRSWMAVAVRSSTSSATGIGRNGLYTWLWKRASISSIGHVDPAGEAAEDLGAVAVAADDRPVDRHGEHALVVGHDAPVGVEDPPPLGQQRDGAQLGGVDLLLQRLLLDGLQEPQAGADQAEQQGADEREHSEAGRPFVDGHGRVVVSS